MIKHASVVDNWKHKLWFPAVQSKYQHNIISLRRLKAIFYPIHWALHAVSRTGTNLRYSFARAQIYDG